MREWDQMGKGEIHRNDEISAGMRHKIYHRKAKKKQIGKRVGRGKEIR